MNKTFILGIGVEKAGTSWLYHLLVNNDRVYQDMLKAYNLWNVVTLTNYESLRGTNPKDFKDILRLYFQNDPSLFFTYHKEIFKKYDLAMDITPTYTALSPITFSYINQEFKKIGVDTKVIFLMRDPIDRIISAWKHRERIDGRGYSEEAFIKFALSEEVEYIQRYEITYKNLIEAFDRDNILMLAYEDLFTQNSIDKISDFVQIKLDNKYLYEKINASPINQKIDVSEEAKAKIKLYYKDTYDFFQNFRNATN